MATRLRSTISPRSRTSIAPSRVNDEARERVTAARTVVDAFARGDQPVYGINTGFGNFAEVRIPADSLAAAAGQSASQPRRRRRRAASSSGRARDDGAAGQCAGEGLLRHPARDARSAHRSAESRRASASCRRADRSAPAAISRPSRTWRWCSSAKARPGMTIGASHGAACTRTRRARRRSRSAPKEGLALINGTQPSTALLGLALLRR